MDDGVTDSVAPINGIYLQAKDGEYVTKAEGAKIPGSHEIIIPNEGDYSRGTNSDIPCSSAPYRSSDGNMVEELTLKNYNSENLAIIGTSNNKDGRHSSQNQWQHLYQIAGGLGNGNAWEDNGKTLFPQLLNENRRDGVKNGEMEQQASNENNAVSAGIRTKILSKSGFSEFFVKNSLKGKGIIRKGPAREEYGAELRNTSNLNVAVAAAAAAATVSNAPSSFCNKNKNKNKIPSGNKSHEGVNLREWLKLGRRKPSKLERLYIFRQILNLVDHSHSQGLSLQHLRPSFLNLSTSNEVIYLGSFAPQENVEDFRDNNSSVNNKMAKRASGQSMYPFGSRSVKKQKFGETQKFGSISSFKSVIGKPVEGLNSENNSDSSNYNISIASQEFSICGSDPLEESWYASPEERMGRGWSFSSNIYVLGVLLFELLGCFDSESGRAAAMLDLRHRILPSNFLSENPKEAGFCLWLLHPEPSSRPTAREVLKSDVISGIEESFGDELSSSIDEDDNESELLTYFLLSLEEQKKKESIKLEEEIKCTEADIKEVERRRKGKPINLANSDQFIYNETPGTSDETRFSKNISQLESAYFSMRSDIQSSINDVVTQARRNILRERDNSDQSHIDGEMNNKPTDRVGDFFSGLCKYARYSKFKVRGVLRNGEFNSSANVICSMSFDRDQEYFAAAGISKKIKIFEFQSLLNEAVDVHYPAVEMSNKSRLSCVCWNSYIRNYLASTDYDGTVKLWDAGTGQVVNQYMEHVKRAWSVDFSQVDPTKLASGSDDYSVKLWSINEKNSLRTIKSIANACCVQFSGHSSHLLAFGSADYKTYCYDLRNVSVPWCILAGHDKAVSYVKFLDSETIVSASTDNKLKIWDLNKTSSSGFSTSACVLTSKGHTNEKNFVGLSVADGYIACGSETNEVYAYYRSLPMPITSHKFGSIDPISNKETEDDNGQFVSSVCWKQNSDMLLAANSSGCIKVLQMV